MATSTFPSMTGAVDNTSAATFIPEIWSDEVVAAYEKNLVLANLVKKMSMQGKKGDTVHIPKPGRGSASLKAATIPAITASARLPLLKSINCLNEYPACCPASLGKFGAVLLPATP